MKPKSATAPAMPESTSATTAAATADHPVGWTPTLPVENRANHRRAVTAWAIGLLAILAAGVYWFMLPGMEEREAFALLNKIPIQLKEKYTRDRDGKPVPERSVNPVTGQTLTFVNYAAYVGHNQPDRPDLAARRKFIQLGDLCGQNPPLAMKVMRAGLYAPMDKDGFPRRMVANEMVLYLRDVRDQFPDDPTMQLTMDDLYQVAMIANGREFMEGTARHGADILTLLLAFPADFPDRVPVYDLDARGTAALGRLVYLPLKEYDHTKFREPFFEQGNDCLLLLNSVKKENFVWDGQLRRFVFTGPKPELTTPAPAGPVINPLDKIGAGGPEQPLPTPPEPPPAGPVAPPAGQP